MRNLKRALSLALALVMVLSMMVVGATAVSVDDFSDGADIVNKEAVSVLVTLGVLTGNDDGSFAPTDTISRAEMSTIICRVLNGGKDPVLGESITNSYTDTASHWAKNYIEYCTTLGIVAGKGDGTFDPEGEVTVAEAAKMVLVALGYNADVEGYVGGNWQINTDARANPLGLYDGMDYVNTNAALTRDNAAQMLYNALNCRMVEYSYIITGTVDNAITTKPQLNDWDHGTLLWEKFRAVRVEGEVIANEYANLEANRETDMAPAGINVGSHLDDGKTTIRVTNFDPDTEQNIYDGDHTFNVSTGENELGKGVYVFVRPYNATSTSASSNANRATVIGSVVISEDNVIVEDASGDTAADVADNNNLDLDGAQYVYNYGGMSGTAPVKDGYVGVQKTLIDTDADGDVNYVLYREMRLGKVTLKDETGDGRLVVNISGVGNPVSSGNYIAEDKDDVAGFDNVAQQDYVLTACIGGRLHVQPAETLTGTIEAYRQSDKGVLAGESYRNTHITVDGESYTVSRVDAFESGELTAAAREFDRAVIDSDATFYLDENGYLIAFGEVDETAYKYALVWAGEDADHNGVDPDRVRVTLEDGTTRTYDLDNNSDINIVKPADPGDPSNTGWNNADDVMDIDTNDIKGLVFPYTLTSDGDIKLYLPRGGAVRSTGVNFTNGLTGIALENQATEIAYMRPDGLATGLPEESTSYFANNATAFFYVEATVTGGAVTEVTDVDVYNGRNAAPTVDVDDKDNDTALVYLAMRTAREDSDVGAVVFFNVTVAESAGNHLFVADSVEVHSEYTMVNGYLNGDTTLQPLNVSLAEGSEIDHNPVIEAGVYFYKLDGDHYELTRAQNEDFFFKGTVTDTRNGNKTFVVDNATGKEGFITENTVVIDNTGSDPVAVFDGTVSVGDEIEVVINSTNDREALMVAITDRDVANNNGNRVNWDGSKPADATEVRLTSSDPDINTQRIEDALAEGDVYINEPLTSAIVSSFRIPADRTLYVNGNVNTNALEADGSREFDIEVIGSLVVDGDLETDESSFNDVAVTGNWKLDSKASTSAATVTGVATVNGTLTIWNNDSLTVATDAELYASDIENDGVNAPTLVVNGHVEVDGVALGGGTITVNSTSSLLVDGAIICGTLNVGTSGAPGTNGRVRADSITANVNVANSGSSLTVDGVVTGNLTVNGGRVNCDGVTGNAILNGDVSGNIGTVNGSVTGNATDSVVYDMDDTNTATQTTAGMAVYGIF